MQATIPTMRVKTSAEDNPDGYFVINASDFDESIHEKFEGEVATLPPPAVSAAPAAPKIGVAELRAYLDDKGIAYDPESSKAQLRALYDADTGA